MRKKLNLKKLKISKKYKRFFITFLIILLLVSAGLITNEVMNEKKIEATQVASSFFNTPGVSYQVYLKDNALYNDMVQSEDIGYFSTLIDHIGVTFDNQYKGVNEAVYQGDYALTGEIIGWEAGTEKPSPAWTKKFVVSSKKTFRTTDDMLKLSQSANIDFNHFNTFIAQVGELTGYNTTYTMKITMVVNYTITTSDGEVRGSLQPSLMIPLGENYFKINKSDIEEIKNDITKTVELPVPVDYSKIILFSTISLLCLILLILLLSSVEPTLSEIQRNRVKKLLKSYGNRIVAIENALIYSNLEICYVHSMKDMIKVSDEIERPILYVFRNDLAEIKEFFITEREKAYLYKVPDYYVKEKKKPDPEKNNVSADSGDGNLTVNA